MSTYLINTLFPQIKQKVFDDTSIDWNLPLRKPNRFSQLSDMSDESNRNVPQIAISAYESNEEDVEVTNLFNAKNEKNDDIKAHDFRSVSPSPIRHKSRILLKSPITAKSYKSLSPALSDYNNLTDVEVMSDSDDEKCYIRTSNLTPGPINYFILTDVEDLSEDEEQGNNNNNDKEELTDTENFTDDKGIPYEIEQTEQIFEPLSNFPQPHREIVLHSKDGTVSALPPTEESNPIWLKTPNEEIKGFESEEETITAEGCCETEPHLKNANTYYHEIDVGVEESVETVKHERCKNKIRNRPISTKKNAATEAECGKKRFRNKNRCNSEIEGCSEKRSEDNTKKSLSKYMSEPTLSKISIPTENYNDEMNKIKRQENNNKCIIHDNINGFSISIDFENHNSVLLSVGRDYGNLSMRWFNNGIMAGRIIPNYNNPNILEPLTSGCLSINSFHGPKRQFEESLFTYGSIKTLQNRYFTYIIVYTVIQPQNIVQFYINKPFQTQMTMVKIPLVKVHSLKDKCTSMERLYPSPVKQLSAFKIFNQTNAEKHGEKKKIELEIEKHVSDVIDIFENMCGSPKLGRKFNLKKLSNSDDNLKKCGANQNVNNIYTQIKNRIGNYKTIIKILNRWWSILTAK